MADTRPDPSHQHPASDAGHHRQHEHGHDHAHGPADGHDHAHDHDGHRHDHAGHDHAGHDHSHAVAVNAGNERVVLIGFVLTFLVLVAEIAGGLISGSLALLADAGHVATDAAALALAWGAFRLARRASDPRRTYGYLRFEVIAGFINAITLFAVVCWIAWEAVERIQAPSPVLAGPMVVVAVIGLVVNIVVFAMLQRGDRDHVNIRGASLHVLSDMLGSIAAIAAAAVIYFTGWTPIDPILSVFICLLVLRSGWTLLKDSLQILMEGTPKGIDVEAIGAHLVAGVPGVDAVSHLHVWSLTSGVVTATLHVSLREGSEPAAVVRAIRSELAARYKITHATIEIDWGDEAVIHCPLDTTAPALGPNH